MKRESKLISEDFRIYKSFAKNPYKALVKKPRLRITTSIFLVAVFALATGIRLLPWREVFKNGEVIFSGPDCYYHVRRVMLTISHYPSVPSFDSYLSYPQGAWCFWPPLFDFSIATIAMIIGLGSPSQSLVESIGALFPPLLGGITIFPVYLIAKEIFDKRIAYVSIILLALIPAHIGRSLIGVTDHHVAEPLMATCFYCFLLIAIRNARSSSQAEGNIVSNCSQYKGTLFWSLLAGIFLAGGLLAWTGSIIFAGLAAAYVFLQFLIDRIEKRSSRDIFVVAFVTFLMATIILFPFCATSHWGREGKFSYLGLSWFQITILGALSIIFLASMVLHNLIQYLQTFSKYSRSSCESSEGGAINSTPVQYKFYQKLPAKLAILICVALFLLTLCYWAWQMKWLPQIGQNEICTNLKEGVGFIFKSDPWLQNIGEFQPLFRFKNGLFDRYYAELVLTRFVYIFPIPILYFIILRIIQARRTLSSTLRQPPKDKTTNVANSLNRIKVIELNYSKEGITFFIVWSIFVSTMAFLQTRFVHWFSIAIVIMMAWLFVRIDDLLQTIFGKSSNFRAKITSKSVSLVALFALVIMIASPSVAFFKYLPHFGPILDTNGEEILSLRVFSNDAKEAYLWMRDHTPTTKYYMDPTQTPSYGVMSDYNEGHYIKYIAQRPTVSDNFGTHLGTSQFMDSVKFFLAKDEQDANYILDRNRVRYVITMMLLTSLESYAKILGLSADEYIAKIPNEKSKNIITLVAKPNYYSLVSTRLHHLDGTAAKSPWGRFKAVEHYRLIYESPPFPNETYGTLKIYEYVKGARLSGEGSPSAKVSISVRVKTNQRRSFEYINIVECDSRGYFSVVVPYSTEGAPYETATRGPYIMTCRGLSRRLNVTERAVINGETIHVDLGRKNQLN